MWKEVAVDYFYFDNNNKKIKLQFTDNLDFKSLESRNKYLYSLFQKFDNGDGVLKENELTIMQKLLAKADNLVETTANNNILENEELKLLSEKIDNGEIKLPKNAFNEENIVAKGSISIQYGNAEMLQMREDPKFFDNQIEKLKTGLEKDYPPNSYDIEIFTQGNLYLYNVYAKNGSAIPSKLGQTASVIRTDGIEIQLTDYFKEDVDNDDNAENKLQYQSASFGEFTIIDKNGNKHKISYSLSDGIDRDALDCRRIQRNVADFFAKLPEDVINTIIENNVEEIAFSSDSEIYPDEMTPKINEAINKDGYYMSEMGSFVDIICPEFSPQTREYAKETNIERDDGYSIKIEDTSEISSEMIIKTPQGKNYSINIQSSTDDSDKYHQWQLPKIKQIMENLPSSVIEDLANEIDTIRLMNSWAHGNGVYAFGSNTISYKADYDDNTPIISFVHELGHAVDNQDGIMYSNLPKFKDKFDEFKLLLKELKISGNHATEMPEELFASLFADQQIREDNPNLNHIRDLDNKLAPLKASDNPQAKRCLELFEELKAETKDVVRATRNKARLQRADNSIRDFVEKEFKELIDEMNQYSEVLKLPGQSPLLEFTNTLSLDDENFEKAVKYYEKLSSDESTVHFEEVRNLYSKIAQKMLEARQKIKH